MVDAEPGFAHRQGLLAPGLRLSAHLVHQFEDLRLDGGDIHNRDVSLLTDTQLDRLIASYQPDPAAWLAWWNSATTDERDAELQRIIERKPIDEPSDTP